MSDQGGCSCVQDISVTLCEENIYCSEKFPGSVQRLLDSCGICHVWNTPPGYSFSGYFFTSLYPLGLSCYLSLVLSDSVLFSVSCFRVWFLTVASVSNTQDKIPPVPGSTITPNFDRRWPQRLGGTSGQTRLETAVWTTSKPHSPQLSCGPLNW